ncbi:MAG: hypothetical protein O2780_04680 [Proteobacteria bacterium]|nr:hypothetical protein [Pseudomonadota bacterium]
MKTTQRWISLVRRHFHRSFGAHFAVVIFPSTTRLCQHGHANGFFVVLLTLIAAVNLGQMLA